MPPGPARRHLLAMVGAVLAVSACTSERVIGSDDPLVTTSSTAAEVPCGETTCAPTSVCCDASCGACADSVEACPAEPCAPPCGSGDPCSDGTTCCDDTCCLPDAVACSAEACTPVACGEATCELGQQCCDAGVCVRCIDAEAVCDETVCTG